VILSGPVLLMVLVLGAVDSRVEVTVRSSRHVRVAPFAIHVEAELVTTECNQILLFLRFLVDSQFASRIPPEIASPAA
jgi:hypothetical protein